MANRHLSRSIVLQTLFEWDFLASEENKNWQEEEIKENNNELPNHNYELPKPDGMFEKIKTLFDGKIGNLAKELCEEMQDDFKEIFGDDIIFDNSK